MSRINYANRMIGESEIVKKDGLTRKQKAIISQVIKSLPPHERVNRNKIIERMTDYLIEQYGEESHLETQLNRMGIVSTKDIEHKVDSYIVSHVKLIQ